MKTIGTNCKQPQSTIVADEWRCTNYPDRVSSRWWSQPRCPLRPDPPLRTSQSIFGHEFHSIRRSNRRRVAPQHHCHHVQQRLGFFMVRNIGPFVFRNAVVRFTPLWSNFQLQFRSSTTRFCPIGGTIVIFMSSISFRHIDCKIQCNAQIWIKFANTVLKWNWIEGSIKFLKGLRACLVPWTKKYYLDIMY